MRATELQLLEAVLGTVLWGIRSGNVLMVSKSEGRKGIRTIQEMQERELD